MKRVAMMLAVLAAFGCAKVNIETAKPIKVDINMRVDVYQHVTQDANSIADQIYGATPQQVSWFLAMDEVFAQTTMDVAIDGRKNRAAQVQEYFAKGYIGENKSALVEERLGVPAQEKAAVAEIVKAENVDREAIYQATVEKNSAEMNNTRKIFYETDFKRAPAGWWFEQKQADGTYVWGQK